MEKLPALHPMPVLCWAIRVVRTSLTMGWEHGKEKSEDYCKCNEAHLTEFRDIKGTRCKP